MKDDWISVKDRLPTSMGNKVLVSCTSESVNDYVGFGHYEKFKGEEIWFNLETGKPFSEWDMTVTHWQPLPNPAKGEDMEKTINGYFYQARCGKIYLSAHSGAGFCTTELTHCQVMDMLPVLKRFINFDCEVDFDIKGYEIAYGIEAASAIRNRLAKK